MSDYVKSGVYMRNGKDFSFNFKTSLRASEKAYFVNAVSELLIDDNYNSILRDLIFDFFIIDVFTNVDTSWAYANEEDENEVEKIDIIGEMEDLVYETNIVEIVMTNAEIGLIDELRNALDLNIEYRTGIHRNMIEESLSGLINTFERKIADIDFESIMEMSQILGDISDELTADKILEAYAKSDMYRSKNKKPSKKSNSTKGGKKSAVTPLLSPEYEV